MNGADPGDVGGGLAEGAHVIGLVDAEGVYDSPVFYVRRSGSEGFGMRSGVRTKY